MRYNTPTGLQFPSPPPLKTVNLGKGEYKLVNIKDEFDKDAAIKMQPEVEQQPEGVFDKLKHFKDELLLRLKEGATTLKDGAISMKDSVQGKLAKIYDRFSPESFKFENYTRMASSFEEQNWPQPTGA